MGHSPDQHVEHAEHAAHAAHDPFDKTITLSIAITAAVLAFVTMLSHRSHNETLRHQADATRLQTEASILHTKATDQWAFYQAKNIRKHEYESFIKLVDLLPRDPSVDAERAKTKEYWATQVAKYEKELPGMMDEAKGFVAKAKEHQQNSLQFIEMSHEAHLRSDRYDLGELGVELALVLSSISLLMRQKRFWLIGIACGVIGFLVALSGYFNLWMPHPHGSHSGDHNHPPAANKAHDH